MNANVIFSKGWLIAAPRRPMRGRSDHIRSRRDTSRTKARYWLALASGFHLAPRHFTGSPSVRSRLPCIPLFGRANLHAHVRRNLTPRGRPACKTFKSSPISRTPNMLRCSFEPAKLTHSTTRITSLPMQLANPTAQSESSHTTSRPILHRAGTTPLFVLANGAFLTRGAARKTLRESLRDLGLNDRALHTLARPSQRDSSRTKARYWLALASGFHLAPRHFTGSP